MTITRRGFFAGVAAVAADIFSASSMFPDAGNIVTRLRLAA